MVRQLLKSKIPFQITHQLQITSSSRTNIRPAKGALALVLATMAVAFALSGPAQAFEPTSSYTKTKINGWTVLISSEFAKKPKERKVILGKIQSQTAVIAKTLSSKHLKTMRKADIWVEAGDHYRALARHHVSKAEIYQEGLNVQKYRDIEVFGRFAQIRHPSLILHELAHVYQDRKLGWYDSRLGRLYDDFEARMPSAKDRCGRTQKAYALKNEHEFFATFTESYFMKTCSYPYDRATIQKRHPKMYAVLKKIWGS